VILEQELDQLKNEHAKVKYWCSELEEEVKQLKKEIKIKEAENTDLHKLYKVGIHLNSNSESSYIYRYLLSTYFQTNNKYSILLCRYFYNFSWGKFKLHLNLYSYIYLIRSRTNMNKL